MSIDAALLRRARQDTVEVRPFDLMGDRPDAVWEIGPTLYGRYCSMLRRTGYTMNWRSGGCSWILLNPERG